MKTDHDRLARLVSEMREFLDEAKPDWRLPVFTEKEQAIIKYCEPYYKKMWAASIMGIVLECDFRECKSVLRDLRAKGVDI